MQLYAPIPVLQFETDLYKERALNLSADCLTSLQESENMVPSLTELIHTELCATVLCAITQVVLTEL